MIPVFLDANVYFAGFLDPDGVSGRLFEMARAHEIQIHATKLVLKEADRNLRHLGDIQPRKRFHHFLKETGVTVVPEPPRKLIDPCKKNGVEEKDTPVLAGAIASRVRVFFTLDKRHFPIEHIFIPNYHPVAVLTPVDLISQKS